MEGGDRVLRLFYGDLSAFLCELPLFDECRAHAMKTVPFFLKGGFRQHCAWLWERYPQVRNVVMSRGRSEDGSSSSSSRACC